MTNGSRLAAALMLAVLGGGVRAETIIVRTGEHPTFSRIVLQPASTPDWVLGRTGGGYELRLSPHDRPDAASTPDIAFDLSRAFDLIPRTRIATLSAGTEGAALAIGLGCDCHATAFETAGGAIVIDVADGPAPQGSPFETRLDAEPAGASATHRAAPPGPGPLSVLPLPGPPKPTSVPEDALAVLWRKSGTDAATGPEAGGAPEGTEAAHLDAGPRAAGPHGAPAGRVAPPRGSLASPGEAVPATEPSADPAARLRIAQDELLRELARAASQGLVTPKGEEPLAPGADAGSGEPPPESTESPQEVPDPGNGSATTADAASNAAGRLSVHAETSIDRDLPSDTMPTPVTPEGKACPDDAAFDLPSWGDDRPAGLQIAEARSSLVGEFDRPDIEKVSRLARLYLFLGFGAEARAVLDAFAIPEDAAPFLRSLSRRIDLEAASSADPLDGQAGCRGAAALWAFLGSPADAPAPAVNSGAVVQAFSALPLHLRRHLGRPLADRFLVLGLPDVARAIRDAIARAPGDHGGALGMIDAGLDLRLGNPESAEATLDSLVRGNSAVTPEAALLAVTSRIDRGERVAPELAASVAALAFENRHSPLGGNLARAAILANAAAGRPQDAFAMYDSWLREGAGDAAGRTLVDLFGVLASGPDDAALLGAYLSRSESLLAAGPGRALRLALADRLAQVGLAAEVARVLDEETAASPEGRTALARAALATPDPGAALAVLNGLDGAEAQALRAEALSLAGEHGAAARAFDQLALHERSAQEAWISGDFAAGVAAMPPDAAAALDSLGAIGTPAASQAAAPGRIEDGGPGEAGTESPAPPGGVPAGPIAEGRQLIDDSRAARAAIGALLEAVWDARAAPGAEPPAN